MKLPLFLSTDYSEGTDEYRRMDMGLYRDWPTHTDRFGQMQHAASARSDQMAQLQKESRLQMAVLRKLLEERG